MKRRLLIVAVTSFVAILSTVVVASPASAVTPGDRLSVMSAWTQTPVSSYNLWLSAHGNQQRWAAYQFDWTTDYCSGAPNQPLSFNFTLACVRHDFGYRNYRAANRFPANKPRIDNAFYADMQRVCARSNAFVRPSCLSVAWTYYQAVHVFGNLRVNEADLGDARKLKTEGEIRAQEIHNH
ncbi:MAG: hypothetical protein QOE03_2411 [Micromonosporaceae bacterium]|jgi:hypothetical protein|nr:hypothetical protein [Micromonosporaceae bacterium]